MSTSGLLCLDSSAIVRLIAAEPESAALLEFLKTRGPAVASTLARLEVPRAVNRLDPSAVAEARVSEVLDRIALIKVDEAILQAAAQLSPTELRSLDAIHLATALSVRDHLEAFVVYDRRLAQAAEILELPVESPA